MLVQELFYVLDSDKWKLKFQCDFCSLTFMSKYDLSLLQYAEAKMADSRYFISFPNEIMQNRTEGKEYLLPKWILFNSAFYISKLFE